MRVTSTIGSTCPPMYSQRNVGIHVSLGYLSTIPAVIAQPHVTCPQGFYPSLDKSDRHRDRLGGQKSRWRRQSVAESAIRPDALFGLLLLRRPQPDD